MARLGDVCKFQSGGTPSKNNLLYYGGDIPWITTVALSNNLIDQNSAVNWITEKALKESAAKIIPPFSIMVGTRVGIGKVAINTIPMSTNQDIISLIGIDEEKWDKAFICKLILSKNGYLQSQARGATIKGIKIETLASIEIPEIPIQQQRRIAATLDKVTSLIDLCKQQLAKLDELVKARFVEMFGNESKFDTEPLELNVQEMFIGPFGSSLKNECFVPKEKSYCMVYEQKHAIKKTMDVETRYVDESKFRELQRFTVCEGDIIVSCRGTIGETYIIPKAAPLGIMHPSIMKIRLKADKYDVCFFNFLLTKMLKQYENETNGTGVKMAITASMLGKRRFIVPPIETQHGFSEFVKESSNMLLTIRQSLDILGVLKASLMQGYFGEV